MITALSANFAHVSATQTECRCKLNCQTQPKTDKGIYETKQHKVIFFKLGFTLCKIEQPL